MQITKKIVSGLLILFFSQMHSFAADVSSKGMADIEYSGRSPSSQVMGDALKQAKINAIERYIAGTSQSMMRNFEQVRSQVDSDVDAYILGTSIVSEDTNKDAKRYSVVVRVDINVAKLGNALQDSSAVGNASNSEKSYITFIFVAREQASLKSYDAKVFKRTDSSSSEDGAEFESAGASGAEYASSSNRSDSITTGGSVEQKSDKIEYAVSTASEINSTMTGIFSTSGFEVVEAEYLEDETGGLISLESFKRDFSQGDDISAETKRNAAKGAQSVDVPYVALGTLDIGMKDIDPVSGLTRVHVTVNGKVIDVSGRFPKTSASVGPVQYAGLGPNQTVARNNALKLAAEAAAKELTEQLNARGVH